MNSKKWLRERRIQENAKSILFCWHEMEERFAHFGCVKVNTNTCVWRINKNTLNHLRVNSPKSALFYIKLSLYCGPKHNDSTENNAQSQILAPNQTYSQFCGDVSYIRIDHGGVSVAWLYPCCSLQLNKQQEIALYYKPSIYHYAFRNLSWPLIYLSWNSHT